MAGIATRSRILELFEQYRTVPGAPFEESHFFDFLIEQPKTRGAVRNSFRGLRRLNALMECIQEEFAVCFSIEDREAAYSLDKFVERIAQLQRTRTGSLSSLQNQIKAGPGWHILVIADLVLLGAAKVLYSNGIALLLIGTLTVLLNAWFVRFAWRSRRYLQRLKQRIESVE